MANGDQRFLDIDPTRLDEEWMRQPKLYHNYALELAEARADMDELKADMDVTSAELDSEIRENPAAFDLPKLTEPAIKATILKQGKYSKILDKINQCRRRVGVLQAAVEGLDQKKKALENLVTLLTMDYNSNPRAPTGAKQVVEDVVKERIRRGKRGGDE